MILASVRLPRGLDYSPDGRSLAFGGEVNGHRAVWILDRQSGALRNVYDGRIDWLAWSPDGETIARLEPSGDAASFDMRIVLIPLRAP